jgi:hypothetical protein
MGDIRLLIAAMWFVMRYRSRQDWDGQVAEAWENSGYLESDLRKKKWEEEQEEEKPS